MPGMLKKLTGLAVGLTIEGIVLQTYTGKHIVLDYQATTLSGIKGDPSRQEVKAFINAINNIPTCIGYHPSEISSATVTLHNLTTTVDTHIISLSDPEKELVHWHQRLGHLDFRKIQFLVKAGMLAVSPNRRTLHTLSQVPKCAACQFGKQTVLTSKTPSKNTGAVHDKPPTLKDGKVSPGSFCLDHQVCSTKGVKQTSHGGANSHCYIGGLNAVCCRSSTVLHFPQDHLNTHETLEAIKLLEMFCLDHGVVPTEYVTDSGATFTSKAYKDSLLAENKQSFAGTGVHHHNAVAERAIRTIMSIAHTMMLHSAIHWPSMADATLWPAHGCGPFSFHFNRVPKVDSGQSPLDIFMGTRQPQRRLQDLHLWGCIF
ncbi:Zinc knuckle [Seminavis robusta]|uniref:Zinc knuckle n=1 Tax=Seminavis robusta TaxID=568900 RepID=A0A9N8ES40_9STRA|nr:Zinc knuckle [Seminavis robusta]|eukprot:Sro1494_g277330.1 Zinc knuckle (372) ;mRNA; r:6422-7629